MITVSASGTGNWNDNVISIEPSEHEPNTALLSIHKIDDQAAGTTILLERQDVFALLRAAQVALTT